MNSPRGVSLDFSSTTSLRKNAGEVASRTVRDAVLISETVWSCCSPLFAKTSTITARMSLGSRMYDSRLLLLSESCLGSAFQAAEEGSFCAVSLQIHIGRGVKKYRAGFEAFDRVVRVARGLLHRYCGEIFGLNRR
jgi:hypothetical protein